jgi:hypothetical protein
LVEALPEMGFAPQNQAPRLKQRECLRHSRFSTRQ